MSESKTLASARSTLNEITKVTVSNGNTKEEKEMSKLEFLIAKNDKEVDKNIRAKNFLWQSLFVLMGGDAKTVKGSDIKLQVGDYPIFKRKKAGGWVRDKRFPIITEELVTSIYEYIVPSNYKTEIIELKEDGFDYVDVDFAVSLNVNSKYDSNDKNSIMLLVNDRFNPDISFSRYRVNCYGEKGAKGFIFRTIDSDIPRFENLGLPQQIKQFIHLHKGLVLVTGPTGSGKSTTLASLLQIINETQNKNIITLEDPVEFTYLNDKSFFTQREVHKDTKSFASGIRAALREAPDIILLGEMRDLETINAAIEAAETGHLVFGTLHTFNAAKTIDRIIQQYPENEQNQIAQQLATALVGIVAQSLIPTLPDENGKPGVCALNEVIRVNNPIRNAIAEKNSKTIIQSASGDPNCLTMLAHAKQLSITQQKVSPKVLMDRFYQEDKDTYELYVDDLRKAGKYNRMEDPSVIEEERKRVVARALEKGLDIEEELKKAEAEANNGGDKTININ